jgi:hypothetical protein
VLNYLRDNFSLLLDDSMVETEGGEEGEREEGEREERDLREEREERKESEERDGKQRTEKREIQISNANSNPKPNPNLISLLSIEYPSLLEKLLEQRRLNYPVPPSQTFITYISEMTVKRKETTETASQTFPLWALILAVGTGFAYQYIAQIIAYGAIIPIFNVLFVIFILLYSFGFFKILKKD